MGFFNSKEKEYKKLFEEQLESTKKAIETAEKWKALSVDQNKSMAEMNKSLDESIAFIKKLQEENTKLAMALALYKQRYG